MDTYPLDLVLAVVVASATIFLGFLPAKSIRPGFFGREAIKATAAWIVVAAISPLSVMHYPFILAALCFIAWWNFQREDTFTGKIWLSVAAGLGISIGVMVILAVTPGALPTSPYPSGPFQVWGEACWLASLYLGGAIIGLAYVGYVLCREASKQPGLGGFILNSLGLLFNLTVARGLVLLVEVIMVRGAFMDGSESFFRFGLVLVGIVLVLPMLAHLARRAAHFSSRLQPTRLLVAIMLVGLVTEIVARLAFL